MVYNLTEKAQILGHCVREREIADTLSSFADEGLDPILIKGWAASQYYPEPWRRSLGDIDLVFSNSQFPLAQDFVRRSRIRFVDLHCGLRHLDVVDWKYVYGRSLLLECAKTPVRVLAPEDHLRVLCTHWLTDGGGYRNKLWDIAYLLIKHSSQLDWDLCFEGLPKHRRRWIVTVVGLAERYLQVDFGPLPFRDEFSQIPNWVNQALKKEWESEARLVPLNAVLGNPRQLITQIRKRIPPNPIQATIEMEAEIDDGSRVMLQIRNTIRRIAPSVRRVIPAMRRLLRG